MHDNVASLLQSNTIQKCDFQSIILNELGKHYSINYRK